MTESLPPVGVPIPQQSAPFNNEGLQQLLALGQENPAGVATAIEMLQSDPKAALSSLFRLTPSQQATIDATSEAVVAERVAPAIQALQSGQLTGWVLDPGVPEPDVLGGDCTCHVHT